MRSGVISSSIQNQIFEVTKARSHDGVFFFPLDGRFFVKNVSGFNFFVLFWLEEEKKNAMNLK